MTQPRARYLDGPVAIIGAGIGGLTAALSLQHFGVPVRVFEQARALREIGAGVTITPNAMNVLDFLGIGSALAEQAGETLRYFVRSAADGRELERGPDPDSFVPEFVERADVLVVAVWLDDFKQLIAQYGERLADKVIIDPTNPVAPDGNGGFQKIIGEQESSGQILAGLLPPGARLVKAFGTLSAGTLSAAARREPERAVLFYAADDDDAGEEVADLIRIGGYEPVRVGGLDQSIRLEVFGDLHEFGALGRVVTKSEALKAI